MRALLLSLIVARVCSHFAAADPSGIVAHEWGTFTSVQGSDGEPLRWNPFVAADLPEFVYDRNGRSEPGHPFVVRSKLANAWLQRMETPVIYFYSNRAATVDVSVGLPSGLITEWYPQVTAFGPYATSQSSFIRWSHVELLGGDGNKPASLPGPGAVKTHYFAARETDAVPVRCAAGALSETEKFLFYRGVADFAAPLNVHFAAARELVLKNRKAEDLRDLFVLEVDAAGAAFVRIDGLRSGEKTQLTLPTVAARQTVSATAAQLGQAMEKSLIAAGLFPREARAMVETWRDSWFAERGVRVLYSLPRPWTDRTLPLSIKPGPDDLVRVMIGRAEIFTPDSEEKLRTAMDGDDSVTAVRSLEFGRFLEPALNRLSFSAPTVREKIDEVRSQLRSAMPPH